MSAEAGDRATKARRPPFTVTGLRGGAGFRIILTARDADGHTFSVEGDTRTKRGTDIFDCRVGMVLGELP